MKTAHEEKLVSLVQQSLDKDPIDHVQFINCFTEENRFLASFLIGHIVDQRKQTDKILEIVTDLSANSRDNKISIVNISKFFILYSHLLEHYGYDLEENVITYDGEVLKADGAELTYLSIELEQYFGGRDIFHGDLLKAIKRYFIRLHKEDHDLNQEVETICQEYLKDSKTKKRTRVPMKYLRANIQIPLAQLKTIMKENNYSEWKDKSKTVYYYKDEN